jgi:hypothetical protein
MDRIFYYHNIIEIKMFKKLIQKYNKYLIILDKHKINHLLLCKKIINYHLLIIYNLKKI